MKEYIVTLWNHQDLDEFYQEMENSSHCECLPDRPVECCHKREISRNTHYFLSEDEAEALLNDKRVRSVSLTPEEMGVKIVPIQLGQDDVDRFADKNPFNYKFGESNWGLNTSLNGVRATLDTDSLFTEADTAYKFYGSLNAYDYNTGALYVDTKSVFSSTETSQLAYKDIKRHTGTNVDVVIVDGDLDGNHIEFQKNTSPTIPETVRYPEKIIVKGPAFSTGIVLNINYGTDINNKVDHYYSVGNSFNMLKLYVESTGTDTCQINLRSGFSFDLAVKSVPTPPIMGSGFGFNYDYYCANSLTGFNNLFTRADSNVLGFDVNNYSGNGIMSNSYTMEKIKNPPEGPQIIPSNSRRNFPSGTDYEAIFFVKNRTFGASHVLPFPMTNHSFELKYLAPDIVRWRNSGHPTSANSLILQEYITDSSLASLSQPSAATEFTIETGSRFIPYKWYPGYTYNPGNNENSNHGMHVASIACGNSQGLASAANIYNVNPYQNGTLTFDYIREFHRNKPINPQTKRKNPTIINNSWGFRYFANYGGFNGMSSFTGIKSSLNSKYSTGYCPIGEEFDTLEGRAGYLNSGNLDLQINGQINTAEYIRGGFDASRILIGGQFTGITLNGTFHDVKNIFALNLHNNAMLMNPVNASEPFFGSGTEGPVEIIYCNEEKRGYTVTNNSPSSEGTILVGGDFTGWKNSTGVVPVKNVINFGISLTGYYFVNRNSAVFTGLNGKVKKIKYLRDNVHGDKYCFMGDFTSLNNDTQNNILITDMFFNKTGFNGHNTFDPPPFEKDRSNEVGGFYFGGSIKDLYTLNFDPNMPERFPPIKGKPSYTNYDFGMDVITRIQYNDIDFGYVTTGWISNNFQSEPEQVTLGDTPYPWITTSGTFDPRFSGIPGSGFTSRPGSSPMFFNSPTPFFPGKVNDFEDNLASIIGDTGFIDHNIMAVGNFNNVGGNVCNSICPLDATGAFVSDFDQPIAPSLYNPSGIEGEVNAIINPVGTFGALISGDRKSAQYLTFGSFTGSRNYVAPYNLRTDGVDQIVDQSGLVDGPVFKLTKDAVLNPYKHSANFDVMSIYHLYGNFTKVNDVSINNDGSISNYISLIKTTNKLGFLHQYKYGFELVNNQKNLRGYGQTLHSATGNVGCAICIDNFNTLGRLQDVQDPNIIGTVNPRAIRVLGKSVAGYNKSLVNLVTTFHDIDKEILNNFGVREQRNDGNAYTFNIQYPFVDSDMEDLIADNVIIVNAAGNDSRLMVPTGDPNYAQVLGRQPQSLFSFSHFMQISSLARFNSAGSPQTVGINVGSFSTNINKREFVTRSNFSNYGPQVHCYAAGEGILGAVNDGGGDIECLGSTYAKFPGTSMASPQICGLLAIYLQFYPYINQDTAKRILEMRAITNKFFEARPSNNNKIPLNTTSLFKSSKNIPNYWLFRRQTTLTHPQRLSPNRDASGILYPKIQNKFIS